MKMHEKYRIDILEPTIVTNHVPSEHSIRVPASDPHFAVPGEQAESKRCRQIPAAASPRKPTEDH